jgi:hypothetical protein
VLGRPEGYSPAEDSSVRTREYELRQKLEELYSTELPAETIRIVVPKGAYAPQYVKAAAIPHTDPPVETAHVGSASPAVTVRDPPQRRTWMLVAGALAACLLGAALTFVGLRSAASRAAATVDPSATRIRRPSRTTMLRLRNRSLAPPTKVAHYPRLDGGPGRDTPGRRNTARQGGYLPCAVARPRLQADGRKTR